MERYTRSGFGFIGAGPPNGIKGKNDGGEKANDAKVLEYFERVEAAFLTEATEVVVVEEGTVANGDTGASEDEEGQKHVVPYDPSGHGKDQVRHAQNSAASESLDHPQAGIDWPAVNTHDDPDQQNGVREMVQSEFHPALTPA